MNYINCINKDINDKSTPDSTTDSVTFYTSNLISNPTIDLFTCNYCEMKISDEENKVGSCGDRIPNIFIDKTHFTSVMFHTQKRDLNDVCCTRCFNRLYDPIINLISISMGVGIIRYRT